ncbi:DNA-binding protein [Streptococcus agalactiae]|uniref:DNA-binding protein n=1 Tax=Streptococcus agalactiae TaxID=1311 RepID=UPI0013750288|nr:DNA-binding protein [Streptococcus agalactiae]KAF1247413.1 DNA-binding protein [Streptococcus agalactiae]HEN0625914.1 DNA-binding protein [Streptococcus agalactiae]
MREKKMPTNTKRVLQLIPVGKERTVTGQEIATITRMSLRTVQAIIRRLIIDYNICICGTRDAQGGYFLPANDTERLEGIKALTRQQQEEEKRITVLMNSSLNEYEQYLKGGL